MEEKKKIDKTFIVKISLSVLVVFIIGFTIYSLIASLVNKDDYILLTNKSRAETQEIYSQFNDSQEVKTLYLLGTQLIISENNLVPDMLTTKEGLASKDGISLISLSDNTRNVYRTDYDDNIFSIDLARVPIGDYLVYSYSLGGDELSSISPYSYHENITLTTYSFPNNDNERKKIEVLSSLSSPYLVIKISPYSDLLPSSYYDAVILDQEYYLEGDELISSKVELDKTSIITSLQDNNLKIYQASSIKEASTIKSNVAISLSKIENESTSVYNSYGREKLLLPTYTLAEESLLPGYDLYPEIRELTGTIDEADEGYYSIVGNDLGVETFTNIGKESYILPLNLEKIHAIFTRE